MFSKGSTLLSKIFLYSLKVNPVSLFYLSKFNKLMAYRFAKLYTLFFLFGLARKPYIKSQILNKKEAQKQVQQQQIVNLLDQIQIKLSQYPQKYFIIISANYNSQNDSQLLEKQKILFSINEQINKKLQINQHYFQDIKFLYIGDQDIYKIIQVNNTVVDFYEKEKEKRRQSLIYIMHRDSDGLQKLITVTSINLDLKSILNVVSKHKARKFAQSMQF